MLRRSREKPACVSWLCSSCAVIFRPRGMRRRISRLSSTVSRLRGRLFICGVDGRRKYWLSVESLCNKSRQMRMTDTGWEQAVQWLDQADALIITAGAGMGVDSGLPDFRGDAGLWRAYPALREAGLDFVSVASPRTFEEDPRLAWGFYG